MNRRGNLTTIGTIVLSGLLLLATACGVKSSDSTEASGSTSTSASDTTAPAATSTTGGDGSETTVGDATTTTRGGSTTTAFDVGDATRDALITGFKSIGLTDEQATCMADGYIDLGFTDPNADPTAAADYTKILEVLDTCHVSLTDLGGSAN